MKTKAILAALLAVLTLTLSPARAATISWTNTSGGNWNNTNNWSPNQVPTASNDVFITQAGTYTVIVNTSVTNASLTAGATSGTQSVSVVSLLTLNGTSIFSNRAVLNLAGGNLRGSGAITVNGPLLWSAGEIDGPGVLNANGGMTISGGADKYLYGTVNNGGTVTWTGGGVLRAGSGGVFNNPAGHLFDAQNDTLIDSIGYPPPIFNNGGTYRKSGGAGTNFINAMFNNTGTVEVQSGTVVFNFGGSQNGVLNISTGSAVEFTGSTGPGSTLESGLSVSGSGMFRVNGAVSVYTNVTLPKLTVSGGNLYCISTLTVNGPLVWSGGFINGPGVLNASGGMTISGSANKTVYGCTINNGGTVTWTGTGYIDTGFGAVLNNPAGHLFDAQNDAPIYGQVNTQLTINNAGTFRKSAGAGTTYIGVVLNNSGTIEVESGTMDIADPPFKQTSGAILLKGGKVQSSNFYRLVIGGGLFGGAGQVLCDLAMFGQLSPGLSAGRLDIAGNYHAASSSAYNVEIGGTIAGTNYDQVAIAGQANLAGSINVCSVNGFVPALGDRFEIMKFTSKSGNVSFRGLDIANGIYLQPIFSSTNLVLVATNTPPSAAPKLNLAYNGDSLWLWWPLGYGSFNVQSATNLNPPIAWSPVTLAELNRHTFTSQGPQKYFRMVKP